ncbi:Chitosanase [Andreprevotia sp. IGB-42]|uniref:chitosanase n=1 Tax=Andreprevotia sp. IGB-42 TaxID=2497473 RepID=UPI0013577E4A|nr:chitosanase [Andreprevotia sp. IGB-42]KAF0813468.1 Chitosanase [Andreprevotia sp. IGB-42]
MKNTTYRALKPLLGLLMGSSLLISTALAADSWQEGTTYTAGTVVSYNGQDYRALVTHTAYVGANWNPAGTPTLWAAQGTSTATPIPTPTSKPTSLPTTTPTGAPVTSAPTATPKPATPTPVSSTCYAAWSATSVYTGGQRVTQQNVNYEAKWWTQGDNPALSTADGVWKNLGNCGSSNTPVPTVTPKPTTAPITPTPKPTTAPITPTPKPTTAPVTPTPKPTTAPVTPTPTTAPTAVPGGANLDDPAKKEIAMQLVSSAENSSLNWRGQFAYIEDIGDGRGYTAGIIGFCSGTGDMLELVEYYTAQVPGNNLASYLPALRAVNNTASHAGLDPNFTSAWKTAAADSRFQAAQEYERDTVYFNPAVKLAKQDGLHALGQFAYYDAAVVHGFEGLQSVRRAALKKASVPSAGGAEVTYLNAFLDARVVEMKKEAAHEDVSRIETAQRVFLTNGNLNLDTPLYWKVYGDSFSILK